MFSRAVSRPYPDVSPAPFGPSMPKSSPSLMPNDTPSRAVTGPSESSLPFGRALRRNRRFFPAKIRVRSRVSTAYVMGDCVRSPDPGREAARLGGDPLPVAGDVPGDPVAHQDASHVGEFGDLRLVVVEVGCELVRIELRQLNRDSLDVRRPDVAQRLAPRSRSGGRSKGSVLDKASWLGAKTTQSPRAGCCRNRRRENSGQLLNRDLGYAGLETRAHRSPGAGGDGRIPRERRVPEEFEQLHRPDPERARRDARVPQLVVRGSPRAGRHRLARGVLVVLSQAPVHVGFRFSMNARIPSALSRVEPTTPNAAVSKSNPAESGISIADRRHAFARAIAAGLFSRILRASVFASSRRRSAGTTRFTRPMRSAVAASIISPV